MRFKKKLIITGLLAVFAFAFVFSGSQKAEARAEMTRDELVQLIGDSAGVSTGMISLMLENTKFDDAAGNLGKMFKGATLMYDALNGKPKDAFNALLQEVGKEVCLAVLKKAGYTGVAFFISAVDTYISVLKFIKTYVYDAAMADFVKDVYFSNRKNGADPEWSWDQSIVSGPARNWEETELNKYMDKMYRKDAGIYELVYPGKTIKMDSNHPGQADQIKQYKEKVARPAWTAMAKKQLEQQYQEFWLEEHKAELQAQAKKAQEEVKKELSDFFGRDWYFHFYGTIKGLTADQYKAATISVSDSNGNEHKMQGAVSSSGEYDLPGPKLKDLSGSSISMKTFTFTIKVAMQGKPEKKWDFKVVLNGKRCAYYKLIDRIQYTQDFTVKYDAEPVELTGEVLDDETGKKIPGARVLVKTDEKKGFKPVSGKSADIIPEDNYSVNAGIRMELSAKDGTFSVKDVLYEGQTVKVYATADEYTVERTSIVMQKQGNTVTLRLKKKIIDLKASILFLVDCSGSMGSNNRIARAREAVINAVSKLGPETEVAVIAFRNCGSRHQIIASFMPCDDANKKAIIEKVKGLGANGDTPLASAIKYANWYLSRNARSTNRNIITLSDGEETCQGSPTAQARALSK